MVLGLDVDDFVVEEDGEPVELTDVTFYSSRRFLESAEDNGGYYLLSYRSRHPEGESGYQKVTVDTVNREFRVRAREGYQWGEE